VATKVVDRRRMRPWRRPSRIRGPEACVTAGPLDATAYPLARWLATAFGGQPAAFVRPAPRHRGGLISCAGPIAWPRP